MSQTIVHEARFSSVPVLGAVEHRFWEMAETLESEQLKAFTELALDGLSRSGTGIAFLEAVSGKKRAEDPRLAVSIAGIHFENPVVVGAGWDKKGRSVLGLHALGFAGVEVGTVPLFGQVGSSQPRMWTWQDSVGLNRLGFNSPGAEIVEDNMTQYKDRNFPIGVNVGINKLTPHLLAPEMHALVTEKLEPYADWVTLNPSSPNTPGLRELQRKQPMRDNLKAVQGAANDKPVFIKIAPDIDLGQQLDDIIEVSVEEGAAGIICANTTSNEGIKARYGWAEQAGGLSGDDDEYRDLVDGVMNRIVGTVRSRSEGQLDIIRVGGINKPEHVIKAMMAGAGMVQVVTGIRQNKHRAATSINAGLIEWMDREGVQSLQGIVGVGG